MKAATKEPTNSSRKRILVAPLNWGLGHATRCVPLIDGLLAAGHEVYLASEGVAADFLRQSYPALTFFELPAYNVRYRYESMVLNMLLQAPAIRKAIKQEQQSIARLQSQHNFDVIISDNRFGCRHTDTKNIFITHQLRILCPKAFKWAEGLVQRFNYSFINAFDECWIPDYAEAPGLAGQLSHPKRLPKVPVKYIGPLSRFTIRDKQTATEKLTLAMVSGPEPQRSYFEKILVELLGKHTQKAVLLRGLPGDKTLSSSKQLSVYNHLDTKALNDLVLQASHIICRSGYSTLMDLAAVGKSALLVPTPGQTEQEYLALHWEKQDWGKSCRQNQLEEATIAFADSVVPNLTSTLDSAETMKSLLVEV